MEIIQAGTPEILHIRRLLAHANDAFPIHFRRREVIRRHLGDRMTNTVIYRASGYLPARDVRQGQTCHHGGASRSEDLESVPQNNHYIGPQMVERIGKADHPRSEEHTSEL